MNKSELPAGSTPLTLGIIALSIIVIGFCCGPIAIVSLVLSIIGLVKAINNITTYQENPDAYTKSSYKNSKTAKILNIIAVSLSGIITLFWVAYYVIYGSLLFSSLNQFSRALENAEKNMENKTEYYNQENLEDDIHIDENDFYMYETDSVQ